MKNKIKIYFKNDLEIIDLNKIDRRFDRRKVNIEIIKAKKNNPEECNKKDIIQKAEINKILFNFLISKNKKATPVMKNRNGGYKPCSGNKPEIVPIVWTPLPGTKIFSLIKASKPFRPGIWKYVASISDVQNIKLGILKNRTILRNLFLNSKKFLLFL